MHLYRQLSTKRSILASAILALLEAPATHAAIAIYDWTGTFTIINPLNTTLINSDFAGNSTKGHQTEVSGTYTYKTGSDDTVNGGAGSGTMTVSPFDFFGSGPAVAHDVVFTAIGDGNGGDGNLLSGTMLFDWNNNNNIFVEIIWDAGGFLSSDMGFPGGIGSDVIAGSDKIAPFYEPRCVDVIADFCLIALDDPAAGATSWVSEIDGRTVTDAGGPFATVVVGGPALVVTVDGNPFVIESVDPDGPDGPLPPTNRHTDGISGIAMDNGPFPGFNANFDIRTMRLISDGSGPVVTWPADIALSADPAASVQVDIGTVTDEGDGVTVEWSDDGGSTWTPDAGAGNNLYDAAITETVNTYSIEWRATDSAGATSINTQAITVTINDTTAPVITGVPADVSVSVATTNEEVCFAGTDTIYGMLTATDAVEPNLTIEWSLTGFDYVEANPALNCSNEFGPNENTVFWQVRDKAVPENNVTPYEQTVTLNLPTGIVGKACEINLEYAGFRNLKGNFIMRNPQGAQTGTTDNTVTGKIDTSLLCTDVPCAEVGATLVTTQAFEGLLWTAEPIYLYGEGTWTFETCPGDNSAQCDDPAPPRPLSMTVNPGQLGAHMLFAWGATENIDVAVVWDVDCGTTQLTTTDPDGDGILGSKMVDGPFIGFNAAFDLSATGEDPEGGEVPLIADGGYVVNVPAYKNPVAGASPLALDASEYSSADFPTDDRATRSCVGGCFAFETDGVLDGTDAAGDYKFVQVVLPLSDAIPFWSLYRKFDETTMTWGAFVVNGRNTIKSSPSDANGYCPEPGSGDYKVANANSQLAEKLEAGDECIQLTIEDNGPNDSSDVQGTVADPGGVAAVSAPPLPDASTSGGGCSIAQATIAPLERGEWWLLGGLLGLLGWARRKVQ